MKEDSDEVGLISNKPEASSFDINENAPVMDVKNGNFLKTKNGETISIPIQTGESSTTAKGTISEAAEERQRTGRYLAIGVTLVMLFIAFYHTLLRHATVLAGLLAPAIIMLLYILWLFYFAKKKKTQVSAV